MRLAIKNVRRSSGGLRETGGRATPNGRWEGCGGATRGGHEHRERRSQIDAEKQVHKKRATVVYSSESGGTRLLEFWKDKPMKNLTGQGRPSMLKLLN